MLNLVKRYGAHAVAYIVGLCTIVSGINPKILPPQYSFLVALAGVVVTAAHHGFTAGQIGAIANAALSAAASNAGKAAAVVLLALGLHGCATVSKVDATVTSPAAQPYIQAAALAAVSTAEANGITAAQISAIANAALVADQGNAASMALIADAVNAELEKLKLPQGDVAAISVLEIALSAAIQQQLGANPSIAQTQAAVAVILKAILAAVGTPTASTMGPPSSLAPPPPAAPTSSGMRAVESPAVVGAAMSGLLIAGLEAFGHLSITPAAASGITVLFTLQAAWLGL